MRVYGGLCYHHPQHGNPTVGGFHKPIYALHQAFTLCAKLLRLKKLLKSLALSVKWLCVQLYALMKSTPCFCCKQLTFFLQVRQVGWRKASPHVGQTESWHRRIICRLDATNDRQSRPKTEERFGFGIPRQQHYHRRRQSAVAVETKVGLLWRRRS